MPNPIGLVTADEAALAGVTWNNQKESYLNTGQTYWTMSPYGFSGSNAYVFYVNSYGCLYHSSVDWTGPDVRPVINLKANVTILSGDGSLETPFVITE